VAIYPERGRYTFGKEQVVAGLMRLAPEQLAGVSAQLNGSAAASESTASEWTP
jgi:hypothetical protein